MTAHIQFVLSFTASFIFRFSRQFQCWKRNWSDCDKRSNPLKIQAFPVCLYYTVAAHIHK